MSVLRRLLLSIFLLLSAQGLAQTEEKDSDLVEIRYPIDASSSYRDRRRTWGTDWGIHWEQFRPKAWESLSYDLPEDPEAAPIYYEDIFDKKAIDLVSIEGGYKYNFLMGSLSILLGAGYGGISTDLYGQVHNMTVAKYYGKGIFILDYIFPEPYVAPYVSGSIWQMKITEEIVDTDYGGSRTTGFGFDYSVGLLLQLNWLEPDLARRTLMDSGLQNTFLDIFLTQHMKSMKADDPSLATGLSLGAGLRLEF